MVAADLIGRDQDCGPGLVAHGLVVLVPVVLFAIDAELTNLLNRMAAGEDPQVVRDHAELAFSGLLS